jgi:hypothetical protein
VDVVVMGAVVMTLGYLGTAGSSILLNTFAYIVVLWVWWVRCTFFKTCVDYAVST